jgi:hypothetical protein
MNMRHVVAARLSEGQRFFGDCRAVSKLPHSDSRR